MNKYKIWKKNGANIILEIYDHGNCYYTIYGKHTHGYYIAIPNWGVCVEAAEPNDIAYNRGELARCKEKSIAASADEIATAIKNAIEESEM